MRSTSVIVPALFLTATVAATGATADLRLSPLLAADGRSGAEIAGELHLSEGTVRNYLSEAVGKLGGRNRVDAARIARQKGWL